MHAKDNTFSDREEIREILSCGRYMVLALSDGNEPYILTLSYGLDKEEDRLYFNSSKEGMKIDFLKSNPYVCGTVIRDDGYQQKLRTHYYHSVVFRGIVEVIHREDEKLHALNCLYDHFENDMSSQKDNPDKDAPSRENVLIMKIDIEDMTGKRNPA